MFDVDTVTFLESGCSLILGMVGAAGEPVAGRGWGLTVLDRTAGQLRLLVDGDDRAALDRLVEGSRIAITATDVRTMRSMQMKARLVATATATDADLARGAQYRDAFFDAIVEAEGTDRAVVERIAPGTFVASVVDVDDVFDQTPGPRAGSSIEVST